MEQDIIMDKDSSNIFDYKWKPNVIEVGVLTQTIYNEDDIKAIEGQ